MKKIIRTNNLQKALEDYDALKGQAVSYVSVLPESPNIRNSVYCKQTTTDIEEGRTLTVGELIENFAQETETANHYVIPATYTITYSNDVVKGIEVSGDAAIMYEDEEFTTALATTFNLEDNYIFDVTTHVTEMAYYVGDVTNQTLHPVVSFGVIAEVNKRIDVVERELDTKADVSVIVQLDNKIDNSYNTLDSKIDNSYNTLDNKIDNSYNTLDAKIDNSYNTLDNKIDNSYNTLDNKIDNSYNTLDNKIDNSYNTLDAKIDNEISNLAVNFTTNNLVANVATVNNATIDNASVNNFDVSSIIANGSSGSDGQVLGKVNGNVEWFSPSLDTNDFKVNYLTVNNSSVTDNATINNLVVNNAIAPRTVTEEVSYLDKNGQPTEDDDIIDLLQEVTGLGNPGISNTTYNFQFLPFITMPESEYNKGPISKGNETWSYHGFSAYQNIISDPVLAFIATAPFGNIYFAGKKIAVANCDIKVTELAMGVFQGSPAKTIIATSTPTSSLVFTDAPVTNNLLDFRVNATVTSILGSDVVNKSMVNLPYGLNINQSSGVITTNIKNTYFDFDRLFSGCYAMTDCFLTNPSLIVNAPSGYNVWNGITDIDSTFKSCWNFNKPITIPNGVTSMYGTFENCWNFNQPITIPDSVTEMSYAFSGCNNLNQPITISKNAKRLYSTFENCTKLSSSSVPVHISHEIALGNTSNYIYNMLVNGGCGITFAASRILNDA